MSENQRLVYPISPEDIATSTHFFDAFGNAETEDAARWLVRFAQSRGEGWADFVFEDIQTFYEAQGRRKTFFFHHLISGRHIEKEEERLRFAHSFVARCFLASPAMSLDKQEGSQE